MRKYIVWGLTLILITLLTACATERNEQVVQTPGQNTTEKPSNTVPQVEKGKLSIMSYQEDPDGVMRDKIRAHFPNVEFEFIYVTVFNAIEEYRKSYKNNQVPDIFIMDNSFLGSFNDKNTFVDLAVEPYQAEELIESYPTNLKNQLRSFDGRKLLTLPISISPVVTFYRYDVLKDAGFPAEPEALGEFIKTPENWLLIAETLQSKNQFITIWDGEPMLHVEFSLNMFDADMNYSRNTPEVTEAIKLGRTIGRLGLASGANLFEEGVQNPIRTEKMVMFHIGYWYNDFLKRLTPETSGLWRVTQMPFGLKGQSGTNHAAISSQSKNKMEAWSVVQWLSQEFLHAFNQSSETLSTESPAGDPFYGGQDVNALIYKISHRLPEFNPTPLDESAKALWMQKHFTEMNNTSISPETLTLQLGQLITETFASDIEILKEYDRTHKSNENE